MIKVRQSLSYRHPQREAKPIEDFFVVAIVFGSFGLIVWTGVVLHQKGYSAWRLAWIIIPFGWIFVILTVTGVARPETKWYEQRYGYDLKIKSWTEHGSDKKWTDWSQHVDALKEEQAAFLHRTGNDV